MVNSSPVICSLYGNLSHSQRQYSAEINDLFDRRTPKGEHFLIKVFTRGLMRNCESGKYIASILLKTGVIKFQENDPFISEAYDGTSVRVTKSPIYIDLQRLLAFPVERDLVVNELKHLVVDELDLSTIDSVAGCESGGIAYAAWLAEKLALPLLYVRKKNKSYGTARQLEGKTCEQKSTFLVDDLTFDGASKINFTKTLRGNSCLVREIFTIFDFKTSCAESRFKEYQLTHHSLTNSEILLEYAKNEKLLSTQNISIVESFFINPLNWNPD